MSTTSQRIVRAVAASGGLTRAEVGGLLGLSRATVMRATEQLLEDGVLVEAAGGSAGPGRPAKQLRLPAETLVGVLTWAPGSLTTGVGTLAGELVAAEVHPHAGETLEGLLEVAAGWFGDRALDAVVFGVPAPFRAGAGLPPIPQIQAQQRRFPSWLETDPATRVQATIENDANLGALGELHAGAGRDLDTSVYVKTGPHAAGAGLIIAGRLHRGTAGFAGELSHVQIRPDGPPCVCGGRGCLVSVLRAEFLEPGESLAALSAEEPAPRRFLQDMGRLVGRPLADLVTLLNPAAIIVDSWLGAATEPVAAGIREAVDRHAAPAAAATVEVRAGELGAHAELIGALHLRRLQSLAAIGIGGLT
jgi:predicted NBD/HSP70 family sugar kinase